MKNINLCRNCEGKGTLEYREQRDGYEKVTCTRCDGTGRVDTRSYSIDLPFGSDIDHDIEKKIFELLTKLKK